MRQNSEKSYEFTCLSIHINNQYINTQSTLIYRFRQVDAPLLKLFRHFYILRRMLISADCRDHGECAFNSLCEAYDH